MAKDDAAPEGGDEGVNAPDDVLELDTPVEKPEEAPEPSVGEIAKKLGWVPKEEFQGDETKWKPADQYILDGKKIQTRMANKLENLSSQMDTMSKTSAAILQEQLEEQRAKLTAAHNQAVEDGDSDRALKISQRLNGLDRQEQPQPNSEAKEWVSRNSWFNTNPLATDIALRTAEMYARNGKSTAEQLQAAEDEVRRAYPHLFVTPKAAPGVAAPPSRNSAPSNRAKGFADMPREAQKIATDMVDRGVIKSVEDYSRNFWASEGKTK